MFIRIENNQTNDSPQTFLSSKSAAGATSLLIKNPNGFLQNYYAQVGQTGEEQTEIVKINSTPTSGTMSVGTTKYDHPLNTPVFLIKYPQVIFKRSTSGTAGTAEPLTGGTIDISADNLYTQFDDTTGSTTYAYKTQYYNPDLALLSNDSPWITFEGPSRYSLYGLRKSVRRKIRNIPGIEDEDIDGYLGDFLDTMRNAAASVNEDFGLGTISLSVGPGTTTYEITEDDYRFPVRVWVIDSGTTNYNHIFTSEVNPNKNYAYDPRYSLPGDNAIQFHPDIQNSGTAQIVYSKTDTSLEDDDDLLPSPFRPYRLAFIDYAHSQILMDDGKESLGKEKERLAYAQVEQFKREISPRQRSGPSQVEIVEETNFFSDTVGWM